MSILGFLLFAHVSLSPVEPVVIGNDLWQVTVEPSTMAVLVAPEGGQPFHLSQPIGDLGPVEGLTKQERALSWSFPETKTSVAMRLDNRRLVVTVEAGQPGVFQWPLMHCTEPVQALVLPHGEGCYVPVDEARWIEHLVDQGSWDTLEGLTLPFWGLDCGDYSLTCIATNRYNNEIRFSKDGEALSLSFSHEFPPNHASREYGFIIELGKNESPVEPARKFRRWLMERGEFVSMKEKMATAPKVERLLGAPHVYLWGDSYLAAKDIRRKQWKPLCKQIIAESEAAGPSVGKRIKALGSEEVWGNIVEMTTAPYDYAYLQKGIAAELSRLIGMTDFYDEASWKSVALTDETKALLTRDRTTLSPSEMARMNGLLLLAAYPDSLQPIDSWGDTVSIDMLKTIQDAGFDRMKICLDGWSGIEKRPEVAVEADRLGYLFGTYDSYHSIHDPALAGTDASWETAQFDQHLYDTGGIMKRDGTMRGGFKQRGYLLSPLAARPYLEQRVNRNFANVSYNYYFIDCDAFGQVYDDYTPGRMVTQHEDAMERADRMKWISEKHQAVVGSEGGSCYAAGAIHVAEGIFLSCFGWGDPDLKDQDSEFFLGKYYPPDGPAIFFKPTKLKEQYRYFHLDPRFRLPLYEVVFHDSVVTTNHWSYDNLKFPEVGDLLFLEQLLYQTAPMVHLNRDELSKRLPTMKAQFEIFSPLHRRLGFEPMTGFAWLTPDRLVQKTTFGDTAEIVANFSTEPFNWEGTAIPAGGHHVRWKKERASDSH